jgi:serine protease AprX
MNIKVINDDGVATTETIVAGINHVIGLLRDARFQGLMQTADLYPNIINISIGGEDDGDENDPIRVAVRTAVETWGIECVVAAGNFGPDRTTITSPGSEPLALTVGGAVTGTINIWDKSSRGPTVQGDTKPDIITWATELNMASNKDDESYEAKSGTSFSAPIVSGLTGLLWETGRINMDPFTAQLYMFKWSEALAYAPYFCIKPSDAALVKDNNYGYGFPAGGAMVQQIAEGYGGQEDITTQLPSMMMMIMMMGLMVPMLR